MTHWLPAISYVRESRRYQEPNYASSHHFSLLEDEGEWKSWNHNVDALQFNVKDALLRTLILPHSLWHTAETNILDLNHHSIITTQKQYFVANINWPEFVCWHQTDRREFLHTQTAPRTLMIWQNDHVKHRQLNYASSHHFCKFP